MAIFLSMLSPRKSLGQNFLRDDNILRKIVDAVGPMPGELVLEIGPGPGALTKPLVGSGARIVAVEVDPRAVQLLTETFGERLQLIHADVRTVELASLTSANERTLRVVGNIPYYLTSEILFWIIDQRKTVTEATLMVQLEVARRLVAGPGTKEYGILSVFMKHYTECRMLFKVSRNCFFPRPDVDSAVIQMRMRTDLPAIDDVQFRTVVRSTFGNRRKTLRNGLKSAGWTDAQLDATGFDLTQRPEELTAEEFVRLSTILPGSCTQSETV
jgi:16S rRNA (adenine1518-N6/adenine1519-N6)-dimethyltransferase